MRKVTIEKINDTIHMNRKKVNKDLFVERKSYPKTKRSRRRSEDEIIALTNITKATIERAKREGKFKMIDDRRLYYDPSE